METQERGEMVSELKLPLLETLSPLAYDKSTPEYQKENIFS